MTDRAVSAHASMRWLERVEGWDIAAWRRAAAAAGYGASDDVVMLAYLQAQCGLDVAALRARIMCPAVAVAVAGGAAGVVVGGIRYVIRDGIIATVKLAAMDYQTMRRNDRRYAAAKTSGRYHKRRAAAWRPGRDRNRDHHRERDDDGVAGPGGEGAA